MRATPKSRWISREIQAQVAIACAILHANAHAAAALDGARRPPTPPPTLWRVEAAPGACADTFQERLRVRAPQVAVDPDAARVLHVTVTTRPDALVGTLQFDDGPPREIQGASCEEVLDGLALMAAITLEPAPAQSRADVGADASAAVSPPIPSADAADRVRRSPHATNESAGAHVIVGAAVEASALAGAVVAAGPFVDLASSSPNLLAPSIRAGLATSWPSRVAGGDASATLRWTMLGVEGCPLRAAIGGASSVARGSLAWRPCVGAEGGILQARGDGANVSSASATRAWFAARVSSRFAWHFADHAGIELAIGLTAPLTRDEFRLAPGPAAATPLFRPPALAAHGGAALFLAFP